MTLIKDEPPPVDLVDHLEPLVMVPYVEGMLHEETVEAVRASGYPSTLWPIDRADPYQYGGLFAHWWALSGDLVIVEQDIVPPPDAIKKMVECEHVWCSHNYSCDNPVPAYGLGLCKFQHGIRMITPTLGEQAARNYRGVARQMPWAQLNERIITLMNHWGIKVHLHEPEATHLHVYETADVAAG